MIMLKTFKEVTFLVTNCLNCYFQKMPEIRKISEECS